MPAFDFNSSYLDDLFGDNAAGRNLIFQTFLDRFGGPRARRLPPPPTGPQPVNNTIFDPIQQPGNITNKPLLNPPSLTGGVASRNQGLLTDFNRSNINNIFGQQAQNEFLGATGRAIEAGNDAPTFTDFLNNDFDLGRRIRRGSAGQQGRQNGRFSPRSRFLFTQ